MAYIPPLPKLLKGSRSHWSLPQVAWWSHPLHHVTSMFPCCLSQTLFPSSLEQILRQWRRSLYLVKSIAACDSAGWLIHSFGAIVGGHIYNHLYITYPAVGFSRQCSCLQSVPSLCCSAPAIRKVPSFFATGSIQKQWEPCMISGEVSSKELRQNKIQCPLNPVRTTTWPHLTIYLYQKRPFRCDSSDLKANQWSSNFDKERLQQMADLRCALPSSCSSSSAAKQFPGGNQ